MNIARQLVHALKVLDESFFKVSLVVNATLRKIIEPSQSRALEHQQKVEHGHLISASTNGTSDAITIQQHIRLGGAIILFDAGSNRNRLGSYAVCIS